jgi:hypothetical protein
MNGDPSLSMFPRLTKKKFTFFAKEAKVKQLFDFSVLPLENFDTKMLVLVWRSSGDVVETRRFPPAVDSKNLFRIGTRKKEGNKSSTASLLRTIYIHLYE